MAAAVEPSPKILLITALVALAFCAALAVTNASFCAYKRFVSAAFSFGPPAIILAVVSFCAATVPDALVVVARLAVFKALIL